MDDPRLYSGTRPALLGFLAAAAFAALMAVPLLFAWAWGGAHCEPAPSCARAVERNMAIAAGVVAAFAVLLGLAVRATVRWRMQRRLDARLAGRAPVWAFAVAAALGALLVWAMPEYFI
jgi:hypothetical protein